MLNSLDIKRRSEIEQLIRTKGNMSIEELAYEFNVSIKTIKKDLTSLEDNTINDKECCDILISSYLKRHFNDRLLENIDKKFKIAKKAVEMIPEKSVVILDSGTTVLQIAKLLNLKNNLVIVTSSLIVAEILENSNNQLIVIGGELGKKSMSFVGHLANQAIESIHADIAFIGCDGFHADGPCSGSYKELDVKQRIIENSKKVILVTDSSKFSIDGLYRFATFNKINHLITDIDVKEEQLKLLSKNIQVWKV
ncbi:DeoR/GlpR family DNA-binding transcription regulator [Clostridium sp. SHJSY1]|uniref:DeoR/GlpR family DNA-binding transcription regulator n=1 Tax=Clostridium sp. SHJSY1 TaxID=2942483 RepID=UPI0028766172|nr:DeoR/GlpR family DNA-binding transcription regulator [Clostridium sp. SHJSY1]MDS0527667.1 DeoR/GlpR family DNA-binding transcription regulator [Clostridium sp. SHJSY1]